MPRRRRTALIVSAIAVVVPVSLGLARWLSTESDERSQVAELLRAQARGDASGMLAAMAPECRSDPRCRAEVERNAARLRRAGEIKILILQSGTSYSLGDASGVSRVAWAVVQGGGLPVVQCVGVRRSGTPLSGQSVELLSISAPIGNESGC